MRKTLFSKYFYICSSIILISTTFLGVVLLVFSVQYFRDDQYGVLERNVDQSVALTNLNYSANNYQYVDAIYLKPFFQLQGLAIDADIFLVDMEGRTLLCSNATDCTHVDYLPSGVMEKVKAVGDYRETGKLGGIYKTSYYTVGRPVVGSNGQMVGAVFASSSSAALTTFLVDIFQMYVISAALVMLIAFIIIYFVTSNMVRPLQDMLAATQSFSKGDFSIRVPVEGDDEVAMLAAAFNSMASSLAVMESTRRSFTANVSHELKTPMTTIGGFIDGILDGTIPPEKQSYYLRIVSGEVQRLSRMVRSMLSIARIEAGELVISPTPVEITDIVTRTVFTFEQRIEEKGIEVRGLDAEKHIVEADADLIHQVVYNLIDNAVKFVEQGGYLEFAYRTEGTMTLVSVKNSGQGVAPEEIPKLFDRFYKSDKSRSLDKNGVGLGLSIVKTIMNLHNGDIFVRSEPGQYTEFVFSLPTSVQGKKSLFRKLDPGQKKRTEKGEAKMNEFERKDWEREADPIPEETLRPEAAPEPQPPEGEAPAMPPAEAGADPQPAGEEVPQPEAAPQPESQPQAGNAQPEGEPQPGQFYQGGSYYTPPQQPQGNPWQGQQSWQYPGQQPPQYGGQGYHPPYGPGWQQGYPGPRTTGWQQPQWGGPNTTGWNQPQGNPWQGGGYRPQNQPGNAAPGQWQGAPAPEPHKKKKHPILKGFLILLGVLTAVAVVSIAGYGIYTAATGENPLAAPENGFLPPSSSGGNSVPDTVLQDKPGTGTDDYDISAKDGGLTNTEIYKKVSPSVVAIVVSDGNGIYGAKGLGSGIIMSEDGYIITNAHLTTNVVDFEVILSDGETSHKAQVVGIDTRNDLAVLKIDAQGLTPAEFGNSEQTEVGERVCVIGSPMALNFQNTLTVGYVSALNRSVKVNNNTINFIQTDAAINPGNSGGPLINAFGQVIGVSSAKFAELDYEGMCFAIPISDAMPIVRELIANGKVTGRPLLGITAVAVKATEAEYYEIPLGLWVNSINPGADIGAKGVREGDIITHIAGEPVYSLDACSRVLGKYQPGDTVSVTVFRRESTVSDTTFTVEVELASS